MSGAYKTLKKSDVQVLPYYANKSWIATATSYNSLGIKIFVGQNLSSSDYFKPTSDTITTDSASGETEYRRLVYEEIKQLYYSNYLSASYRTLSSSFDNFEQTTICTPIEAINSNSYQNYYNSAIKYFPTASDSIIRVISIPKNIIGSKIIPGTFQLTGSGYNILDDKEGNLFDNSSTKTLVGNIIYPHGLAIITNPNYLITLPTASSDSFSVQSGQKSGSFWMSFKGEYIIFENQIHCHISEDEFNYTLNPSITTDFSGSLVGFATGSVFNPYVTTIGLYNQSNELLAVGKLSSPIFIPRNSDITFKIQFDL